MSEPILTARTYSRARTLPQIFGVIRSKQYLAMKTKSDRILYREIPIAKDPAIFIYNEPLNYTPFLQPASLCHQQTDAKSYVNPLSICSLFLPM
jgi:hypothetical protein